jgi:hypothetical protein
MARQTTILDQWGRPFALTTFWEGGDRFRNGDSSPMTYWNGGVDTEQLLPFGTWQQALSSARYLLANVPMIRGALLEQCLYSFPLEPHYRGKDKAWGKLAKQFLFDWRKTADVRGPAFDGHTSARIRLLGRKVDGDIGRILTFDRADNFPRLQFVRAHRIGSAQLGDGEVKKGRYAGQQIRNGVITDRIGRPLAYRILMTSGNAMASARDADFDDVEASAFVLTFNPDYPDQYRGISEMMSAITSASDLKRLNDYEMRAQQIQSQEAIAESNEEGEAAPGQDYPTNGVAGSLKVETRDKGLIRYYRAGTGSQIVLHRPDRPGPGCQEFESRIVARMFYGMQWDPNFALALKDPGGAWARIILKKINATIAENQRIEAKAQLAEDTFGLARATKYKFLPEPNDGDIWSWDYSGPARLTADSGNDEAAKREKYKLGILTLQQWAAEDGNWWEETRQQKEDETRDLLTRAQAIKTEFPELTLMECVNLLEMRTPNGPPAKAESDPESPEDSKSPKNGSNDD